MPPTLLCIHGWGLNGSVWQDLAGALAGRARVLAPDLPGHGARAGEGRFGGLEAVADELAAGLDARVCVVGWSLGGLLALSLARRHPDKVSSLVLLAATPRFVRAPDWPHAMDPGVLADFARDLAGDFSSTLARFLALQFLGAPGRGEALRTLKARCLAMPPAPGGWRKGSRSCGARICVPNSPALRRRYMACSAIWIPWYRWPWSRTCSGCGRTCRCMCCAGRGMHPC